MSLGYAWQKFFAAVQTLADGTGSLQDRLKDAFGGALIHLQPQDLPKEHRNEFADLRARITKETSLGDGTIAATTSVMSDEDAMQIADQIVSMYDSIAQALGKEDAERE